MHHNIVLMHPFAGLDAFIREADDLAEFDDRRAWRHSGDRHFVAAWHADFGGCTMNDGTGLNRIDGGHNGIGRIQPDKTGGISNRGVHGVLRNFCGQLVFNCGPAMHRVRSGIISQGFLASLGCIAAHVLRQSKKSRLSVANKN